MNDADRLKNFLMLIGDEEIAMDQFHEAFPGAVVGNFGKDDNTAVVVLHNDMSFNLLTLNYVGSFEPLIMTELISKTKGGINDLESAFSEITADIERLVP